MIKTILNVRWNIVDIIVLPIVGHSIVNGKWFLFLCVFLVWLPMTGFLERYGKKNWGWQ